MREITLAERLRYRFDNIMARGTVALIGWLALLTLLLIIVISLVALATGTVPENAEGQTPSLFDTMWTGLMHTIDAGTIAGDDTGNPAFVFLMVIVTAGGIFIFSTLIGVLSSGIDAKIDDLRKGRSFVVEENHTVILGWSSQIFQIISELVIANGNRRNACIAILAEKDKVEMEEEIRSRIPDTRTTRIVCRTGSPIDLTDLEIINPNASRSIIILSSEADDPDAHTIKTMLALTNNPHRRSSPFHIVAEIRDPQNLEVARMIAGNEVKVLPISELISRIAVQTCRQSGLSVVYNELLDFGGSEIYFKQEPGLAGKTFGDALLMYETSALIGVQHADKTVKLMPGMEYRFQAGDQVIVVAEDDDRIHLSGRSDYQIDRSAFASQQSRPNKPERTLILGWNQRGTMMVNELDHYVAPGSETVIVSEIGEVEQALAEAGIVPVNQKLVVQQGVITQRRLLDSLKVQEFDHIITLSYMDTLEAQDADARTLITLLHLRDIADKRGQSFSIVSEMLDVRNRELAEVTRADDFIVSDKLISLMLSQISENPDLMAVMTDLFDPDGAELYLKPMTDYVQAGKTVNFYTVVEAARQRGEIAIGYRLSAEANDVNKAYGVYVNPNKAQTLTFKDGDRVVVLAES